MITYQDYLNTLGTEHASSEAGSSNPQDYALSEEQYNALSTQDKFTNTPLDRMYIKPGDPRYEALAAQTGAEPGRTIVLEPGQANPHYQGITRFNDFSRVVQGDGYYAYAENNETPEMQATYDTDHILNKFLISAAMMVGGAALGGAFAGGATGDVMGAAAGQGFGTAGAGGAADAWLALTAGQGGGAAGGAYNPTDAADLAMETSSPTYNPTDAADLAMDLEVPYNPTDAADLAMELGNPSQNLGPGGGLDPETWAGNGGMSVSQNGLGSWNSVPWQDRIAGLINNPMSAFSSTGMPAQIAGGVLDWLSSGNNMLRLAGLASSLGDGNAPSGSGPSRGSSGASMSGGGSSVIPGRGGKPDLEDNPYAKKKPSTVGSLTSYLRG